jgi:hypothetical protein
MTLLAEGHSLKDGAAVLAKIAPNMTNGSLCLEREAQMYVYIYINIFSFRRIPGFSLLSFSFTSLRYTLKSLLAGINLRLAYDWLTYP